MLPPRLLLALALLLAWRAAAAQERADTTAVPAFDHGVAVSASPLWSTTSGFGMGVGYKLEHFLAPGSELVVMARPAQHVGRYSVTLFTADPLRSPLYGIANVFYETTGRQWFYGLGPGSSDDARTALEKRMVQVELRLGTQLPAGGLFAQPLARYVRHSVVDVRAWDDGAREALPAASQAHLAFLSGAGGRESDVQAGVWYGLTVGRDRRDAVGQPRSGTFVQATAQRFSAMDDLDLTFDRFGVDAYGYVPLGAQRQVLALRLSVRLTRNRGDDPAPFYMLPSFGSDRAPGFATDRFYGNDLLALGAEYRRLLFGVADFLGVEAALAVNVGSVYDDLFEQFEPGVSFASDLSAGRARYPLRPALGLGGRVVSLVDDRVFFEGMLGVSPEGFGAATTRFVVDLRTDTRD